MIDLIVHLCPAAGLTLLPGRRTSVDFRRDRRRREPSEAPPGRRACAWPGSGWACCWRWSPAPGCRLPPRGRQGAPRHDGRRGRDRRAHGGGGRRAARGRARRPRRPDPRGGGRRRPQRGQPAEAGLSLDYSASVAEAGARKSWSPAWLWSYATGGDEVEPVVAVDDAGAGVLPGRSRRGRPDRAGRRCDLVPPEGHRRDRGRGRLRARRRGGPRGPRGGVPRPRTRPPSSWRWRRWHRTSTPTTCARRPTRSPPRPCRGRSASASAGPRWS